jgi:hypothetical protein
MGDKTFRDKVGEEMKSFARIYADFQADYNAKWKKAHGLKPSDDPETAIFKYRMSDRWTYLFAAPIEAIDPKQAVLDDSPWIEEDEDTHEPKIIAGLRQDDTLRETVLETVKELKLNELRLGGVDTDDYRINIALSDGILTEDDLESLYEMSVPDQLSKLGFEVNRQRVDGSDPFFWRTLLEIFCRAYLAPKGRPLEWSTERNVSLAFDLIEIGARFFKEKKWSNEEALKILRQREPYKSKYSEGAKWKISLNAVKTVMQKIGPIDDQALKRLKELDEHKFLEELDRRYFKKSPKNLKDLLDVLERVDRHSNPKANPVG